MMIKKLKYGRHLLAAIRGAQNYLQQLLRLAKDRRYKKQTPSKRILRRLLEGKKIKQVLGLNLLTLALATSVVSPTISAFSSDVEEITTISALIVQLTTEHSVRWPIETISITQGYSFFHKGVDFAEAKGLPVYPIMDGVVEVVIPQRFAFGNHIIVNHGSGFKSLYAHLAKIIVVPGEAVDKNTVIGTVGNTGWSTGPHLHLEVYDNGRPFNPLTILK